MGQAYPRPDRPQRRRGHGYLQKNGLHAPGGTGKLEKASAQILLPGHLRDGQGVGEIEGNRIFSTIREERKEGNNQMEQKERDRIIKKLSEGDKNDNYYVYALCDPSTHQPFYIGKGKNGRLWQHEDGVTPDLLDALADAKSAEKDLFTVDHEKRVAEEIKAKHRKIAEIKQQHSEIEAVIVKWGLTESEAFMAESSLINLCKFQNGDQSLTNIVNGHSSHKEKESHLATTKALRDTEFLDECAVELVPIDKVLFPMVFVRVDKSYQESVERSDREQYLYECARGMWKLSLHIAMSASFVLALYNGIVVAAYHVNENSWFRGKDAPKEKLPPKSIHPDAENSDRLFFEKCDDNIPKEIFNLIGKEIYYAGNERYLKSQNTKYNYNRAGQIKLFKANDKP